MRPLKRPQRTLDGKWEPAEGLPPKVPKVKPTALRCGRCEERFTQPPVIDWFRILCPVCALVIEAKIARRK